jgi:hypothetical protein
MSETIILWNGMKCWCSSTRLSNWLKEVIGMSAGKVPVKAILIDLSGTLHVEDTAIPGAVDALKRCPFYCMEIG